MSGLIVYSFRTCPYVGKLKSIFNNVFIFGKLKEDIEKFFCLIIDKKPDLILGIASSSRSHIETKAINQFNRVKKIDKNGQESFDLFVPEINIQLNKGYTDSFCNYVAYNVSKFIFDNKLKIKHGFIHLNKRDIWKLKNKNKKCPHEDLNLDCLLRKEEFYPIEL